MQFSSFRSELEWGVLARFVPDEVKAAFVGDLQSVFPTIAKTPGLMDAVENAIQQLQIGIGMGSSGSLCPRRSKGSLRRRSSKRLSYYCEDPGTHGRG